MLARHIAGYAPSLIVTALLSFASVTIFTSLMSQAEYGQYSLAINAMTMMIGVFFYWLQSASTRLLPHAVETGGEAKLVSTLYATFFACSITLLILALGLAAFAPLGDWRVAAWFAAPLAVLRALLNLNQSVHRSFVRISRYNVIEIGQAIIGLAAAVLMVVFLHRAAAGAAAGAVVGFAFMAAFDWRTVSRVRARDFDWQVFKEVAYFGSPFIVTFGLSFVLSGSDRFLIEYFLGPDQVGIYSAGYAFPDRVGQNVFLAVATASFPLVVRRMEKEGVEAARDQTYINGVAIMVLAVPACIGLLFATKHIAAALIGKDFRAGAAEIMPWIAVATIFNGVATHYFDHALHLAKKTRLFFYTLGPAALLNFFGNLYAIPHYGIRGAAYTTLAAYALYLSLSIVVGRSVFRIKFPFKPALQIVMSTALMGGVLSVWHFPENLSGLISMVVTGAVAYGAGLLVFDVMGFRSFLMRKGKTDIHPFRTFEILTTPAQIESIAAEWQALHEKAAANIFGGYDLFQIWWRNLGQSDDLTLHIAVMRGQTGDAIALLPFAVRRRGMLRILEWAGYEVFDYGDILAFSEKDAEALWNYVWSKGGFDIALIKDVHDRALILPRIVARMRARETGKSHYLTLDFPSGEAWLAAQSRKFRGDARRKREKMATRGAVAFHVHHPGQDIPDAVVDTLYRQKTAWFTARRRHGVFLRLEMKGFLQDLIHYTARQQKLYLAWLTCGDAVVACHMGFVQEGILHLYLNTYDAAYAAYSPGIILMIETVKEAIDNRYTELDFMRGEESYKERFASESRPLLSFVAARTWMGKISLLIELFPNPPKKAG